MGISEAALDKADVVIEAGVAAAEFCRQEGLGRVEAVDKLCEGLIEDADDMAFAAKALSELLSVALLRLDAQQVQVQEVHEGLQKIRKLAREHGIPVE